MDIDKLYIGFSKAKGFKPLSWLIRLFEGTNYSHVYTKFHNNFYDDIDIYQASKGFVNHTLESQFISENEIIAEFYIEINNEEKKHLIKFLRNKLGKPYSVITLIGIFLSRFGIISKKFYDGDEAYICSELVARVLLEAGKVPWNYDVDKATPGQLFDICKKEFNRVK